jgi:hypothetical protein
MLLKDKVQEYIDQGQPIRLHLGCGPVKLDGYLNVDGDRTNASSVSFVCCLCFVLR